MNAAIRRKSENCIRVFFFIGLISRLVQTGDGIFCTDSFDYKSYAATLFHQESILVPEIGALSALSWTATQ